MTDQYLNTADFSSRTGISVNLISRYLREGRLKGEKRGGKWVISAEELDSPLVTGSSDRITGQKPEPHDPPQSSDEFSVAEFSLKSYLTEKGVSEWLFKGLLQGRKTADGQWRVSASNLENPNIKRLMRE